VDLNSASEDQLQEVPGIGPSLAKKIVDFRKENGPFKSVDDLLKVRGVGEKSLEKLRPHLTVGKK
jgi:competence protein ComEA